MNGLLKETTEAINHNPHGIVARSYSLPPSVHDLYRAHGLFPAYLYGCHNLSLYNHPFLEGASYHHLDVDHFWISLAGRG